MQRSRSQLHDGEEPKSKVVVGGSDLEESREDQHRRT
jgi:hypothetical protein